jgi:hypothetical protein
LWQTIGRSLKSLGFWVGWTLIDGWTGGKYLMTAAAKERSAEIIRADVHRKEFRLIEHVRSSFRTHIPCFAHATAIAAFQYPSSLPPHLVTVALDICGEGEGKMIHPWWDYSIVPHPTTSMSPLLTSTNS